MAIKATSVHNSIVLESNRFEPKMYIFQSILSNCQKKYPFVVLDTIATAINRGQSPKPETYKDKNSGKYVFIRTADVKKYQFNTESAVYLDEETFSAQKSNRIKKSDILISVVGNYLGSTSVIPNDIEVGVFNDNSARIRIVDNTISPYYVSAFFNSVFGQKLIQSLVTRTGQKILSAGNVKKLSLPIIDDKNIASKYESASNNGVTATQLISQAQQLFYTRIGIDFKSIGKENVFLVSKSDFADADLWTPKYSYPLYVNTLKAIQAKWQTVAIGEIADLKKGDEVGSDTYIGYLDKRKSDVPFVRTSDIVNYEIDQYPDFFIPKEIYDELGQGFQSGDVLFTNDGKIGQVGIVTECDKFILQSHIKRIRLKDTAKKLGLSPEYVFLALTIKEIGIYQAKRYTIIQSTIPTMANNLEKVEIPILNKETISEITDLVKEAFKLKDEKKRLIAEVREIMDGYFEV